MIRKTTTTVTTSGSAGSASGSGSLGVPTEGGSARVVAIRLSYTGEPATTDVTITDGLTGGAIVTVSNSSTAATVYPSAASAKADGTASTLTEVSPICTGKLNIAVAQGDNAGTVTVTAFFEG